MDKLGYIIKIIIYLQIIVLIYININKSKKISASKKNITIPNIILFAVILGIYSIICGQKPYASDRLNFAFRFSSDIYDSFNMNDSYGLYVVQEILHLFTYDPKYLFFTCTVICFVITMIAYNIYKKDDINPYAILLLGLSYYWTFSFYMLKQSIAISFGALAFSFYSVNNKKGIIISIIIAILFHESAIILIPVFIAIYFINNKQIKKIIYTTLLVVTLMFPNINNLIIKNLIKIFPSLTHQINYYLNNQGSIMFSSNLLTVIKGFPFYFVFLFSIINKKELSKKIEHYDEYMFITFFISISVILSNYMYWMFRFGIYLYFPFFAYSSTVLKNIKNGKSKTMYFIILTSSLLFLIIRILYQYYFYYGGF